MNRMKRILITAIAVFMAIGAFSVNSAKAAFTVTVVDNMEAATQSLWTCEHSIPADSCYFPGESQHSLSGAYTLGLRDPGNWTGIGRSVTIPSRYGVVHSCTASFWLKNSSIYDSSQTDPGPRYSSGEGQIEVINPPTWTYISLQQFSLPAGVSNNPWIKVVTASWPATAGQIVYVRLVNSRSGNEYQEITVDDLNVACSVG